MTKLQKIGLSVSVVAAILWIIGLFAGRNYSFPSCGGQYGCLAGADYHLIHFVLIVLFVIGIGLILAEVSRRSLKKSCIILMISWLFGEIGFWFSPWFLAASCMGNCTEVEIPGHIFGIFGMMCVVLWFVALFFAVKYLTNSKKCGILAVLIVASLLGTFLIQFNTGCQYLLGCLIKSINILFGAFLIISIILCIVSGIKRYKEVKKSS